MSDTYDAVVVGAGINGLVAAAELALAGWSVAVVERSGRLGGFMATDELTLPGYRHDTFSSWHPEFVTGGAYGVLGEALHRHDLAYANADAGPVTATVRSSGEAVVAHRDVEETLAGLGASASDRNAYRALLAETEADIGELGALLGGELRAVSAAAPVWRLLRGGGGVGGLERRLRLTAQSGRALVRERFDGDEADALWIPWLLHSGLSPDHASGAIMLGLFAFTIHAAGLPVVVGGQSRFVDAFAALLAEHGVDRFVNEQVERVLVSPEGRAVGVATVGRELHASRAVIASCAPGALYGDLLPEDTVPAEVRAAAARYRPGRAAMQIHLALRTPVPWSDPRLASVPLLHLSDGSSSVGIACAEAEAGLLPRRATVVVGQQCVLDPSRAPEGAATLWIQLQELPWEPVGDGTGSLDVTAAGWGDDGTLADAYADRIVARLEEHAPGVGASVLGRAVLSPRDLASANVNAIGGDPYAGATELDQRLLWRPVPGAANHATPVDGLWQVGAATHPGPGLSGASGHMVAQTLLRPTPRDRAARTPPPPHLTHHRTLSAEGAAL